MILIRLTTSSYFWALVLICMTPLILCAQKGDKTKFKIKGNISVGSFHYYDNGINQTLSPFGASFGVNANISYGKFSIPISVSINNQGTSFQNPFNRYGISPTYKWIKVNLGWRRMQFSKFTMNGVQFFGVGMELTPGLFRFSAMHGKLDYRIAGLPRELIDNLPDRKISAIKLGVGSRRNYFNLVLMKAKDDIDFQDSLTKPKENAAIGADLKFSLFKNKVVFTVDGGLSVFTENRKLDDEWLKNVSVPRVARSILDPNNSTHVNYAVEAGLAFNFGVFSLKNLYRRVMPEYQSLGLNYLRNDQESLLFSPNLRLWKSKVNLSGSIGLEKNNLDGLRNLNQSRVISSANVNLRPHPSHSLNFQFANFSFDQTVKFDSLITNSVVIQHVNRTIGGSYICTTFGSDKSQVFSITANLQNAINVTEESLSNTTFSATANYSISKIDSKSSLNFGINYFDVSIIDTNIRQVGLNAGYTYRMGNNSLSVQGGSMVSFGDKLLNNNLSFRYRMELTKKINLELSSRIRHNQRAKIGDKMLIRSDVRLMMKL